MIVGVLLAAGSASRFGGDKLLADLGDGKCVAEVACANLLPAVDHLIAVLRPDAVSLARRLAAAGAEICVFASADQGMGASLAQGVAQTPEADGWLIALADMPLIATVDARRVADALRAGASLAVPVALDRRGHPVGFAREHFLELTTLRGDHGGRTIRAKHVDKLVEIPATNAQAWLDVDTAEDLELARTLYRDAH